MGLEIPPLLGSDIGSGEDGTRYHGVFIRAPAVMELGAKVTSLCAIKQTEVEQIQTVGKARDVTVAVRQDNILATAFHPELTKDLRWHRLFLAMCAAGSASP